MRWNWLFLGFLALGGLLTLSCVELRNPADAPDPAKPIRVATDATWQPFEFINPETHQFEGYDIDLMKAIAANSGFEVEFLNVSWDPLLEGMAKEQYDAAISSITITEDRKKEMLFSEPYFAAGQMVVVIKDNIVINGKDSLAGNVGFQEGTTGDYEVKKIKAVIPRPFDKIELAFKALLAGEIDAVVCDNPVALLYVGKYPDKLRTAGAVFTKENYGIAIAKHKTELQARINSGLKSVKSEGLLDQLAEKWLK